MTLDSKVSDVTLSPCPFCGGEAEMEEIGNDRTPKRRIIVKCKRCRAEKRHGAIRFDMAWLRKTAIEDWNTRANQQPSAPVVEAIAVAVVYLQDALRDSEEAADTPDESVAALWKTNADALRRHIDHLRALLPQSPDTMRKG